VANVFAELRKLCEEENYTLVTPVSQNRKYASIKMFDDAVV